MKNTKNYKLVNIISEEVPVGTIFPRIHVLRMKNFDTGVEYYNVWSSSLRKFFKLAISDLSEVA